MKYTGNFNISRKSLIKQMFIEKKKFFFWVVVKYPIMEEYTSALRLKIRNVPLQSDHKEFLYL